MGLLEDTIPDLDRIDMLNFRSMGELLRVSLTLFGNLVIGFEKVLDERHLEEAMGRLRRYIVAL